MASKEVTTVEQDLDLITGRALPEVEDGSEASENIVREILSADGLGALFRQRTTVATRNLIGIPLLVRDYQLRLSTIEGTEGIWMLIDAVRIDSGEVVMVNTGAKNIMALLIRAKQLEKLPVEVEVIELGRARPGQNAPLGIAPYGKTAEEAAAEQQAAK